MISVSLGGAASPALSEPSRGKGYVMEVSDEVGTYAYSAVRESTDTAWPFTLVRSDIRGEPQADGKGPPGRFPRTRSALPPGNSG